MSSSSTIIDNAVFCAQTVQGTAIRNLFELMKDVLVESNIIATPEGLRLLANDNAQCVVTSVHLQAQAFELYSCKQRTVLGINLANMYKLVKSASNNDVITMWTMSNEDVLHIRIENTERSSNTYYKLKLFDINETILEPPSCQFEYIVSLPASEFQRMVRDMAMVASTVFIKNDDNTLTLSCYGDYAAQETVLTANQNLIISRARNASGAGKNETNKMDTGNSMIKEEYDEDANEYSLRYLNMFARGSSMSSNVQLYIKSGAPLILSFNAATLGKVLFCLGPLAPIAP